MSGNGRFARVLKSRDVIAIGFGAMIGWNWVLLTGYWIQTAGSLGTALAFVIGGIIMGIIGLTYAELTTAMPIVGGEHVWTERGLGNTSSFVCTWALLYAYLFVSMFEAVALPTAMEYLLPQIRTYPLWVFQGSEVNLGFVCIGIAGSLIVTIVNVRGIKMAAILQSIVTGAIFVAGLILITGAVGFGELSYAKPLFSTPVTNLFKVLILVPAMLIGFDVIPQSAEEIDLPPNRIGRLLMFSMFIAILWYILVSIAAAVALPPGQLSNTSIATADAASNLWGGRWAGVALVLGGIGGIFTSWNAFFIGASRVIYALAKSGMLPSIFCRLHPRYKTPYIGVITIGILSCLAPFLGRSVILWTVNATSFGVIVAYLFVAITFLVLRRNEPDLPRPFKVRYPRIVGYTSIVLSIALLSLYMPWSPSALVWPYEWCMLLGWAVIGSLFFNRFYRHSQKS